MAPLGLEVLKTSRLAAYTVPLISRAMPHFPEGLRKMIKDGWLVSKSIAEKSL
jgi:hypothetical protein